MTLQAIPTSGDKISWVRAAENHPENRSYVYQWTEQEHLASLSNPNIAHYIIYDQQQAVAYVILEGVCDPSHNLNLRRIVVTEKNRGYGTKILQLIKKLAFESLGAHRLWLDVFCDNHRAYQLYKKVGFREEGMLRESYLRDGEYASQYIMALLASEYRLPELPVT